MPNPTTRAEAKQMMLAALAGETVNGARLANPGACTYLDEETGCTCIVGSLMTPEQRMALREADDLKAPIVRLLKSSDRKAGWPPASAFGGMTEEELNQLQDVFDSVDDQDMLPYVFANLRGLIESMPD